jgi:hypothetical protein
MAIRSRLITPKPVYDGFPHPEFVRYVWRYGHLYAEFISPGMIKIDGRAPNVKKAPATIDFYTKAGLVNLVTEHTQIGVDCTHYTDVLAKWPHINDAIELPSYVNPTRHSTFVPLTIADK